MDSKQKQWEKEQEEAVRTMHQNMALKEQIMGDILDAMQKKLDAIMEVDGERMDERRKNKESEWNEEKEQTLDHLQRRRRHKKKLQNEVMVHRRDSEKEKESMKHLVALHNGLEAEYDGKRKKMDELERERMDALIPEQKGVIFIKREMLSQCAFHSFLCSIADALRCRVQCAVDQRRKKMAE